MKRFVGVVGTAALMVTLAATSAPHRARTTAPIAATDVSAYVRGAEPPSTLVVEPVPGEEEQAAAALTAAGHPILRRAGGALEIPATTAASGPLGVTAAAVRGRSGCRAGRPGRVASVAPAERAVPSAQEEPLLTSSRTGANGGEGADAIGVAAWRAAELTGRGTRLAVIDTGFGQWDTAATSGDVRPMSFDPSHDLDLCDDGFEHTNHGTATSEIIYDVAPDVDIVRVCIDDAVDLAEAVPWLITQRVQVVNMSLGFYNTARGDGQGGPRSPDQSVRQALAAGIQWVNSAGNEAQLHWGGPFTDANGDGRHEWVAGEPTMSFTLPPKAAVTIYLKWDEWTAPADDFALCLATTPTGTRECYPGNAPAKGTPTASVGLTNPFDAGRHPLRLGAAGQRERRARASTPSSSAPARSSTRCRPPAWPSPPASPAWYRSAWSAPRSDVIRPYSSQGPTLDGRLGVTVAAPGPISSVVIGPAVGCQGGYGGTSASAPHVAAALALIRQGLPHATPEGVLAELVARIQAAGDPGAPGPDTVYGYGVLELGPPDTLPSSPNGTTTTTPSGGSTTTTHAAPPSSTVPTTSPPGSTSTSSPGSTDHDGPPGDDLTLHDHDHGRSARVPAVRGLRAGRLRRRRPAGPAAARRRDPVG